MNNIKFIEVNSELGAGTRGASLGVDALRVCCANQNKDLFKVTPHVEVETENDLLFDKEVYQFAKRGEGMIRLYERISEAVKNEIQDFFPIVLAGDHSNAGGTIAGIKKAYPNKRLGVIWIDAHADIHTPYTTPSGNLHGMPIGTALGINNDSSAPSNELTEEEIKIWDKLKNIGNINPKFKAKDLIYIAVRDTEEQEKEIMRNHNIKNYMVSEVRKLGLDGTIDSVKNRLKDCDIVYVSFDVDSMDSSISVGTGTPVEHGLTVEEAKTLVAKFGTWEKTICLEFAEINPCLDTNNVMARTAFNILDNLVNERNKITNEHNIEHTGSHC